MTQEPPAYRGLGELREQYLADLAEADRLLARHLGCMHPARVEVAKVRLWVVKGSGGSDA